MELVKRFRSIYGNALYGPLVVICLGLLGVVASVALIAVVNFHVRLTLAFVAVMAGLYLLSLVAALIAPAMAIYRALRPKE